MDISLLSSTDFSFYIFYDIIGLLYFFLFFYILLSFTQMLPIWSAGCEIARRTTGTSTIGSSKSEGSTDRQCIKGADPRRIIIAPRFKTARATPRPNWFSRSLAASEPPSVEAHREYKYGAQLLPRPKKTTSLG